MHGRRRTGLENELEHHRRPAMDEVLAIPYVNRAFTTILSELIPINMAATESRAEVSATPVPYPTSPVARESVANESQTFDWTPVPTADRYRLQIAATEKFEETYYDDVVERPATLNLSTVLPEGMEEAYWRIQVEEGVGETPWSVPARFEMARSDEQDGADFLVNASPVPRYPTEGDAVEGQAAAFAWEAVPEASGYRLQVGQDADFDDPDLDLTVDQVTSLSLFGLLPKDAGSLVWRVRALFPDQTEGPWSSRTTFRTEAGAARETTKTRAAASKSDAEVASAEGTPQAAGPSATGYTSRAMAITFIIVLVVSFVATVAGIMVLN